MTDQNPSQPTEPGKKHCRVTVTRFGGPEVLQVIEEDVPEPASGQVRLQVLAAGVSGYDLLTRRSGGTLPGSPKLPFTLGEDFVGVVDALGQGVSTVALGQVVAGWSFGEGGGYAGYICRPESDLVPVPDGLDPAEAVCLVVNYLTAYEAMHEIAQVKRGERILVHGAAGGVGTALLQLGKLAGLEMYGTASKYNHEVVSDLGATPIDYRAEDFVESIRRLTGDGVDVVLDPVGGGRLLRRSYRTLRDGGRLVWFGMAATKKKGLWVLPGTLLAQALLSLRKGSKQAPLMPDLGTFCKAHETWYRETLTKLFALGAKGSLKPLVAERIPLVEARRAHELLERGEYAGKVVLIPGV